MSKSFLIYLVLLLLLGGCVGSKTPIDGESLKKPRTPGLRVFYIDGKYRYVRQLPNEDMAVSGKGRPGAIIPLIDHQFGESEVFDSGRNREVGVQITGYLLLDQRGSYAFQALSNDGVEVIIDGTRILVDPGVHSQRLSDIGTFSVQEAGWHTLMVKYFQRKGSAALRLFWKTPGKDAFEIIPARAYGHLPATPED